MCPSWENHLTCAKPRGQNSSPRVHASLTLLVCEKSCCLRRARYKNLNILELNRTKIWLVTAWASMPQPQSTKDANVATRRSTAIVTPITLWWAQPGITAATETVTTSTPTFTAEGTENRKNTSRHKPTQHLPEKTIYNRHSPLKPTGHLLIGLLYGLALRDRM